MENRKKTKIKEAQSLRSQKSFPFSLFSSPDYEASGELFAEAAALETCPTEKAKLFVEAAETYLRRDCEYNWFQASIYYEKAATASESFNKPNAIDLYCKAGRYANHCFRESIAAANFKRAAELHKELENYDGALECMEEVLKCYQGPGWVHHQKQAIKDVCTLRVRKGMYEEAAKGYMLLNDNIYNLCSFLCFNMAGVDMDLDIRGEESVIHQSFEIDNEAASTAINEYLEYHAVNDDVRYILNLAKEKMSPENDIRQGTRMVTVPLSTRHYIDRHLTQNFKARAQNKIQNMAPI